MRYEVFSLDMWGHVSADCCPGYGCKCMVVDMVDDTYTHDDDACECHEDCNAQYRCGTIDVPEDANDAAILDALAKEGFLNELGRKVAEIDDYSDGPLDVNDDAGRRLFHLMPAEEE
jgi:hypothetical protein